MTPAEALDNMATIVRNEMLAQGTYLTPVVVRPDLAEAGAICGGHQACAVGSLWLGAGIRPLGSGGWWILPGVGEGEREEFLADHPTLAAAYVVLNEAARAYADAHGLSLSLERETDDGGPGDWTCEVEALFETYYSEGQHGDALSDHDDAHGPFVNRADLLDVIEDAKARLA